MIAVQQANKESRELMARALEEVRMVLKCATDVLGVSDPSPAASNARLRQKCAARWN